MRRYLRVYRTFFFSAFARELEFRANFFAKLLQNAVWILFYLILLLVIYSNTERVAGWGRGEAFVLTANVFLVGSFIQVFTGGLHTIPEQVRKGTLDFVITKPIDTQFWVSCRVFNFSNIGTVIAGIVMIVVGLRQSGLHPDAGQWAAYLGLMACAVSLYYSFVLALMTLGIWLVRVDNLWVLGETVLDIARFPTSIYEPFVQRALLYYLPLALVAMAPTQQLTVGVDPHLIALGLGWGTGAFLASRWFWNFALRYYGSASS